MAIQHIVETFDAGLLDTGTPYIVMELLQGKTLADLITASGPLDLKRACDILMQACDAVHSAHMAGIVHRDLKPENLFLAGPDCSFVKILDFGISKFDVGKTGVEGLTVEGTPIGTPYYMSPEQIKGEQQIDARSDVYALGVVLYESVTGQRPFESDNLLQLIYLVSQGTYVEPSKVRPGLPVTLDVVIAKAMTLDRGQRYASAEELSGALSRFRHSLAPTLLEATVAMQTERPMAPARGALALTPEPVSKTLGGHQGSVWPRRSTVRVLIALGLGALALLVGAIAFGPTIARSIHGVPGTAQVVEIRSSSVSTEPARHSGSASSQAASAEPSAAEPSPPAPPMASAPVASSPPQPEAGPRVYPPQAAPKRNSPAPGLTHRADSYGLSKDNPFKHL